MEFKKRFADCYQNPTQALVIIGLVGFLVRAIIWLEQPAVIWPDSQAYFQFAMQIATSLDFTDYPVYRTPLYSTFLALFLQFGDSPVIGRVILGAQQGLGLLTAIFFYLSARRWFSPATAFFGALLFAVYPLQLYYELVIQTEVLFCFLFSLALYYSTRFLESPSPHLAIAVGALFGIAALTRPVAQLLFVPLILVYFLRTRSLRRAGKMTSYLLPFVFLVTLPWMYWNSVQKGYWGLSREVGLNLFHRLIDVDKLRPPKEDIPDKMRRIYRKTERRDRSIYFTVWHSLIRDDLTEVEVDKLMTQTGLAAIRAHPMSYAINTSRTFFNFFYDAHNSLRVCEYPGHSVLCSGRPFKPLPTFPRNYDAGLTFSDNFIKYYFKNPGSLMGYMNLVAIAWLVVSVTRPSEKRFHHIFVLLIILYFSVLTSIFNSEEDRFRLPIDPLLLFAFVAACEHTIVAARKRLPTAERQLAPSEQLD